MDLPMKELVDKLSSELETKPQFIKNVIKLLFEDECTIPFVARYRKEQTSSMNETGLRYVRDSYQYGTELNALRQRYIKVVENIYFGQLSDDRSRRETWCDDTCVILVNF